MYVCLFVCLIYEWYSREVSNRFTLSMYDFCTCLSWSGLVSFTVPTVLPSVLPSVIVFLETLILIDLLGLPPPSPTVVAENRFIAFFFLLSEK